jgi:hypothetical protein
MRASSGSRFRKMIQAIAVGAFTALLVFGRLGFWAIAFCLGLVMEAIRPGRLYCMWLCPIRAAHGLVGTGPAASNKDSSSKLHGNRAIKVLGWAFIAVFIVLFGISLALGIRRWLFPVFVGIALILSFKLSLPTLCSSFCPLGAAFTAVRKASNRISARFSATSPKRPSARG